MPGISFVILHGEEVEYHTPLSRDDEAMGNGMPTDEELACRRGGSYLLAPAFFWLTRVLGYPSCVLVDKANSINLPSILYKVVLSGSPPYLS